MFQPIQYFAQGVPDAHVTQVACLLDRLERVTVGEGVAWNMADAICGLLRCHELDELTDTEFDLLLASLEAAFLPASQALHALRPTHWALLEGFAALQALVWMWRRPLDLSQYVAADRSRARLDAATFAEWVIGVVTGQRSGAPA